jgi:hypothetical protein
MRTEPTAQEIDEPRKLVGVFSATQTDNLRWLFTSLERVFAVRFEQAGSVDPKRLDGALVLGSEHAGQAPSGIPWLVLRSGPRARERPPAAEQTAVVLAEDVALARPLRGAQIIENAALGDLPLPLPLPDSGRMLASAERRAVWWQSGEAPAALCVSAYPLAELREGEALRDHLRPGCFMGLLPLLHFLGLVLGAGAEAPPPLRASFIIDDPNLHWPTYGFLKYGDLVDHASEHGYHVALATVPFDGWLVNRRAASLIRENPSALSLLMHGNDHVARELGRLSDRDAELSIAQALRRIAALEHRSGVTVDRAMAPPHGACSEAALRAMFRLGIEAACVSRPYPWRDGLPAPTPLAGWHPAEMVAGGLPVLPRHSLSLSREDLVFRALLGQPLILYGHHQDFADGLDLFAQAAGDINRLGDVRWGSLSEIAHRNYTTRRAGEILHVGMHARRISIEVPDGVRALHVQVQEPLGGAAWRKLSHPGGAEDTAFRGGVGETRLESIAAPCRIDLALCADHPLDPTQGAGRGRRPWPLMRRVMVEGRDRIQPLLPRGAGSKAQSRGGR